MSGGDLVVLGIVLLIGLWIFQKVRRGVKAAQRVAYNIKSGTGKPAVRDTEVTLVHLYSDDFGIELPDEEEGLDGQLKYLRRVKRHAEQNTTARDDAPLVYDLVQRILDGAPIDEDSDDANRLCTPPSSSELAIVKRYATAFDFAEDDYAAIRENAMKRMEIKGMPGREYAADVVLICDRIARSEAGMTPEDLIR